MSIHGVLGETTDYPKTYNPNILFAIERAIGRSEIAYCAQKLAVGMDWWHAYEVSWLDSNGISKVAVARFSIPASSPNIVESKSLKLYLNSLNLTNFADIASVKQTLIDDLSKCVGANVEVDLHEITSANLSSGFNIITLQSECIDDALNGLSQNIVLTSNKPDMSLLATGNSIQTPTFHNTQAKQTHTSSSNLNEIHSDAIMGVKQPIDIDMQADHSHQVHCNLLRSNCPVTNQPDWGTVAIDIDSKQQFNKAGLLAYILSYRLHNGFHEQCVEQIFADLSQYYSPSKLIVRAWYTRRGGIDINPCRVSDIKLLPQASRLLRQ